MPDTKSPEDLDKRLDNTAADINSDNKELADITGLNSNSVLNWLFMIC